MERRHGAQRTAYEKEFTMSRNMRLTAAVMALAALTLVVVSASSASGRAKASRTTSTTPLAQIALDLKAAEGVPRFKPFGGPINVHRLSGKKIFWIPFASAPGTVAIGDAMASVGNFVGVTVTACNNHGTPTEWSACLQQALSTKQDLVVLNADPSVLGPQLRALHAAGIPVLSAHFFPEGVTVHSAACTGCSAGITAVQPASFYASYKVMADWAIVDSKGTADVLAAELPGLAPTIAMDAAMKHEFARCKGCVFKPLATSVQDIIGSGFQSALSSALNADPKIGYVLNEVGSSVPATLSALNIAGRTNVKAGSRGGSVPELTFIQQGTAMKMTVGEPARWVGFAAMDNAFRILLHKPANPAPTPVRLFTTANISAVGNPPNDEAGYGSWVKGYLKEWGYHH
jgi:ribose transport system substrate-binding protein